MIAGRMSGTDDVESIGPPLTTPCGSGDRSAWLIKSLFANNAGALNALRQRPGDVAYYASPAQCAAKNSRRANHHLPAGLPVAECTSNDASASAAPPTTHSASEILGGSATTASAYPIKGGGSRRGSADVVRCYTRGITRRSARGVARGCVANDNARGAAWCSCDAAAGVGTNTVASNTTTSRRASGGKPNCEMLATGCRRCGRFTNAIEDAAVYVASASAERSAGLTRELHHWTTSFRSRRADEMKRRTCSSRISAATSRNKHAPTRSSERFSNVPPLPLGPRIAAAVSGRSASRRRRISEPK